MAGSPAVVDAAPSARFSPNVLLLDSNRTENYEIYSALVTGGPHRRLTNDEKYDSFWPRLSPAGDRLLFLRTPKGAHDVDVSQASIWMLNAGDAKPRQIISARQHSWTYLFHPEWSPDGRKLVMLAGTPSTAQILVTDDRGRNPTPVLKSAESPGRGTSYDPSWSPDGKSIVFVGCPQDMCNPMLQEVYTVRVDGTGIKRLTNDAFADYDPYWSPDGRRISWTRAFLTPFSPVAYGTFSMKTDGSDQRTVINDGGANGKPSFAANGRTIYFHRKPPGRIYGFSIWRVNIDGSGLAEVTKTGSLSPLDLHELPSPGAYDDEFPDVVRFRMR
jgi:Tol biopolymer transport system component